MAPVIGAPQLATLLGHSESDSKTAGPPVLERVDLRGARITLDLCKTVLAASDSLQELHMSCEHVSCDRLGDSWTLWSAIGCCTRLVHLSLYRWSPPEGVDALRSTLQLLPSLVSLDISYVLLLYALP